MKTSTQPVSAAACGLVARSFAAVTVIWWLALVGAPIAVLIVAGIGPWAVVLGVYYGVVLHGARRALPMLLRRGPQEPDGAELARGDQPRLWRAIDDAAGAVGSAAVEGVSLTLEPAIGGARGSLRIGLPLLAMLSVDELRVLVRHRLAGDAVLAGVLATALAPVELALRRFDERMAPCVDWLAVLLVPHATAYLRLSRWASRRRQLTADTRIAAAGDELVLRDALRVATLAPLVWDSYWHRDVVAALDAGYRPPLLEGFAITLDSADVRRQLASAWRWILDIERAHPYAVEPLPAARVGASADRAQWPGIAGEPAATMLEGIDALERRVLAARAGDAAADKLLPVAWDDVAQRVYADSWARAGVAGTVADLPALAIEPDADAGRLGAAFAAALQRSGWKVCLRPAHEPLAARADGAELEPWAIVAELALGGLAPARRLEQFAALGIDDLSLEEPPIAMPDGPPAPPRQAVSGRVGLPPSRRTRVLHIVGMLILGTFAMPVGVASIVAAMIADLTTAGRVFLLVIGLGSLACVVFVAWKRTLLVYGPAALSIEGETLTITHPLMREPLVAARSGIRAAAVDPGQPSAADPAMDRRFPIRAGSWAIAADPDGAVDWLWRDGRSVLPRLDVADQPPNVAIVLDPTILTPPIRQQPDHGPLRGEALPGILLTTDDPAGAASLFAAWGVLRQLDLDDAGHVNACITGEERPELVPLR